MSSGQILIFAAHLVHYHNIHCLPSVFIKSSKRSQLCLKSLYHCSDTTAAPYQTRLGRPQTERVAKDYSMHKYMKLKYVNNLSRSLLVRLQHEEVHKAARRKEPGSRAAWSDGRRAPTGVTLH